MTCDFPNTRHSLVTPILVLGVDYISPVEIDVLGKQFLVASTFDQRYFVNLQTSCSAKLHTRLVNVVQFVQMRL